MKPIAFYRRGQGLTRGEWRPGSKGARTVALVLTSFLAGLITARLASLARDGEQIPRVLHPPEATGLPLKEGERFETLLTASALARKIKGTERGRRKVFVDVGANCGNSYHKVKNDSSDVLRGEGWETYLWEANPQMIRFFLFDIAENDASVEVISKAASTRHEWVEFYLTSGQEDAKSKADFSDKGACDPKSPYSPSAASTLYGDAKRAGRSITVEALDFVQWLEDLELTDSDTLVVKMDIEGAEFDILNRMLQPDSKVICSIEKLMIEFHGAIFEKGSETYVKYSEYRRDFPNLFKKKCGRTLNMKGWH